MNSGFLINKFKIYKNYVDENPTTDECSVSSSNWTTRFKQKCHKCYKPLSAPQQNACMINPTAPKPNTQEELCCYHFLHYLPKGSLPKQLIDFNFFLFAFYLYYHVCRRASIPPHQFARQVKLIWGWNRCHFPRDVAIRGSNTHNNRGFYAAVLCYHNTVNAHCVDEAWSFSSTVWNLQPWMNSSFYLQNTVNLHVMWHVHYLSIFKEIYIFDM